MSKPLKLLIVDDETDVEMLFRQHFRKEIRNGLIHFEFAFSAQSALEKLGSTNPPEFIYVFSDINMPGMSGLDLLEIVKERYPQISVSMISAYGNEDFMNDASLKGAEEFFTKPIDFKDLKQKILALIKE